MDVVVTQEVSGAVKIYFLTGTKISPANGGWVEGTNEVGSHFGVPVQQVIGTAKVPDFRPHE